MLGETGCIKASGLVRKKTTGGNRDSSMHSAILPTPQHAQAALGVLPGNPHLAISAVMIHNVSRDDALKITALVDRSGLSPLVWEPTLSTNTAPVPTPEPEKPVEPEAPKT